jgi:hypothetical protein
MGYAFCPVALLSGKGESDHGPMPRRACPAESRTLHCEHYDSVPTTDEPDPMKRADLFFIA